MKFLAALCAVFLCAFVAHSAETGQVKAIARVVLSEAILPDPATVRDRVQLLIGKHWPITGVETDGKQALALRVAEGVVLVTLVREPVPEGELAKVCHQAVGWKNACDAVALHKSHLVVSVRDTPFDKVGAALLLTQAVAALMDDNAIASYWGESLQSRGAFLQQSETATRDKLPLMLWLHVRLSYASQNGRSISTSGLRAFDLLEIESKDVNVVDAQGLYALVMGMANYVLSKGPVIKDGDAIGEVASQSIVVRVAPSYWTAGEQVYRVVYPLK